MISLIFVGRNDNYGGDFEQRLLSTAQHNTKALLDRGIEHEIVFVEWNPLVGEPLLSERVVAEFDCARCIVVAGDVHRALSGNPAIAVYEYLAKNVGVQRSRGSHVLVTNPDNFLGRDVLDFLARGTVDADTLYRAGWINIETAAQVDDPTLHDAWAQDPAPYCCASGDFIFCSRTLFDRVGGFREDLQFTNTHKDSIFCLSAFDLTSKAQKIGNTYHLTHGRDQQAQRRLEYRYQQATRTRQSTYGLANSCVERPLSDRITELRQRPLARLRFRRRCKSATIPPALQVDAEPAVRSKKTLRSRVGRELVRVLRRLGR